MPCETILNENKAYWTQRSKTYSEENQAELNDRHKAVWSSVITGQIARHFPDREKESLHILEVGTGPGFFAIILAEAGYHVTAIDLTPSMLLEAKKNAGHLAESIDFREMNAEELSFPDGCFDVIVTRNLTWNLPHAEKAYSQWCRVLNQGGLLLNFDANWYNYLFYDDARAGYTQDRENTSANGFVDLNIGENYDKMENIARRLHLSSETRPEWDCRILSRLGMTVTVDKKVWETVWSEQEKHSFSSTPMFMISATR